MVVLVLNAVFFLLINVKMPTINDIITFMSRINFVLSWVDHEKCFATSGPGCATPATFLRVYDRAHTTFCHKKTIFIPTLFFKKKRRGYCNRLRQFVRPSIRPSVRLSVCPLCYLLLNHWTNSTKFGVWVTHINGACNGNYFGPPPGALGRDQKVKYHLISITKSISKKKKKKKKKIRERSGSVVECLTRDRRAAGSSLTGVTAL